MCFNSGARTPISSAIDNTHTHDSSASDLGRVSVVEMAVSRLPAAGKTVSAGAAARRREIMYLLARRAARWTEKGVAGAVGCTGRESEVASALNESLINRYTPYILFYA